MRTFILNQDEIILLYRQDPRTENDGGWQKLLIKLQQKFNRDNSEITLDDDVLEKIPRYAFDYKNGGWEDRLKGIFSRHLGNNLGR